MMRLPQSVRCARNAEQLWNLKKDVKPARSVAGPNAAKILLGEIP